MCTWISQKTLILYRIRNQGVAHRGGFGSNQVWYPAVSLYTNGDTVSFSLNQTGNSIYVSDAELDSACKEMNSGPYKVCHHKMPSSGALDQTLCILDHASPTDSLVTDIELCLGTACNTGEFDGKWFLHAYTRSRNLDADDKSVALSDDDNKVGT